MGAHYLIVAAIVISAFVLVWRYVIGPTAERMERNAKAATLEWKAKQADLARRAQEGASPSTPPPVDEGTEVS